MVDHRGMSGDREGPELVADVGEAVDGTDRVISFRVRLNIGRDLEIEMEQKSTIKQLKERISEQLSGLDPTKIKIIARGKLYQNTYLLSDPFPIHNGDVIQATFPSSLYAELEREAESP